MSQFLKRIAFFMFSLIMLLFFIMLIPKNCSAREINVELVWKFGDAGWIQVKVIEGSYELTGKSLDKKINPGSTLQVGWGGWAPALRVDQGDFQIMQGANLELNTKQGIFQIKTPAGESVSYRGNLNLTWLGDRWQLVNKLDEEEYLKGVVPIEMSNVWADKGFEALKAQSVAARTFMVKHTQQDNKITDSPNIDQAYLGKSVEGIASNAVEATSKQIMVDVNNKQPINAFYSAHNGGYTEDTKNVWGGIDNHYSSHPDPYSDRIGGAADRWYYIASAPVVGKAFGLGPVQKIKLDKFPSGRVKKVEMTDWQGQSKTVTGRQFVQAFYPFGRQISTETFLGNLFSVQYIKTGNPSLDQYPDYWVLNKVQTINQPGPLLGKIVSSYEGTGPVNQPYGLFLFNGRGWGHGIGMSQWGAYRMAQLGYSYTDILNFYYDNVQLVKKE